jgi:hypothetical protein
MQRQSQQESIADAARTLRFANEALLNIGGLFQSAKQNATGFARMGNLAGAAANEAVARHILASLRDFVKAESKPQRHDAILGFLYCQPGFRNPETGVDDSDA